MKLTQLSNLASRSLGTLVYANLSVVTPGTSSAFSWLSGRDGREKKPHPFLSAPGSRSHSHIPPAGKWKADSGHLWCHIILRWPFCLARRHTMRFVTYFTCQYHDIGAPHFRAKVHRRGLLLSSTWPKNEWHFFFRPSVGRINVKQRLAGGAHWTAGAHWTGVNDETKWLVELFIHWWPD